MNRARDPLTWLALIAIGFVVGLHFAPSPQDLQDRAVEAEARADTLEMALEVTAARMDTLTTTCWGVLGEHVEMARIVARWPVGMYGPRRAAPERAEAAHAASAP